MDPKKLPVYQQKDKILEALQTHQVIVVESPTGSGKTTQLPIILHEAGYTHEGMVGITQPRRIAAVSVSDFIAKELGTSVPGLVGYKMRFEDMTTPSTRIKVMTDGILLQELKGDYELSQYSVLIVDEAHERSLNIDFILGLLKQIVQVRPEFRVIISSATLNTRIFSEYFWDCPIISIDTRTYPVEVVYDPPDPNLGEDAVYDKIVEIVEKVVVKEEREGDILIFQPGEADIKATIGALLSTPFAHRLYVLPLYARLSKEEQEAVFPPAPPGRTKVVVATNIAETSVTIDGITTVIDPGTAKINYYNPKTFTSSLIQMPISKASAEQRRGRAGRTRPGVCYRLYTEEDFQNRPAFTVEEIYRTDLSEVVLRMADLGIRDFASFDFISPPERAGIISAVETLHLLDALDEGNNLTPIGQMMVEFPLLPRHSRMILEAAYRYPEVMREVLIAASFLTTKNPFLLPQDEELEARSAHHSFRDKLGDFVSYLKLFRAYQAARDKERFCRRYYLDERVMDEILNIEGQLEQIVVDLGLPLQEGGPLKHYLCAVARGHIQFVCIRSGKNTYRTLTADKIEIHPGSVMYRERPDYIVAGEIVRTSKTFARSVSPLKEEWLDEIALGLAQKLAEKAKKKALKTEKGRRRKAEQEITLGRHTFPLATSKSKKKMVILPWKELREAVVREGAVLPHFYRDLKGKILYQNYEIMSGEKLEELVEVARLVRLPHDFTERWPRGKNFSVPRMLNDLVKHLPLVLKVAPVKKQGKRLGFLALRTDGIGTFWFSAMRNYLMAAEESLAALEYLIDQLASVEDPAIHETVNRIYRKLSKAVLLEEEPVEGEEE
ncbi:helicase-related protein [Spirochaeta thermophila]|uniref:RNA helicase n=1 Tax=Winmispira thermophila (strain ATCC 49972 / DSM 6192 / RI 19.B1) TaxID=665571 RepID=E0RN52_WINT6|nr:ATP-dependent RNA helicase [Spirochaeta thermophila]ADN02521.1 hypothetical protein STHERM_c15810 [Spirochaeta thermophila DSM 6192]